MLFAAYLPADRRRALARGETLPDRAHGTVLFADISGFTPLTEGLARALGPRRGAEELTHQLNRVYDALIAEIDRFGGSVVGFAGDAITCWFDEAAVEGWERASAEAAPTASALRATACAFALQGVMRQFTAVPLPGGASASLRLKVAIASGAVHRFLVGDPRIQVLEVLAGAAVTRLALADKLAQPGAVLLDAPTLDQVGAHVRVVEWYDARTAGERFAAVTQLPAEPEALRAPLGPRQFASHAPQLTPEQARPWLLPTVYDRLHAGLGEFLTELRRVVALFARVVGSDHAGATAAGADLDAYIRWVQKVLARYDGVLLQFTIGDKGTYFYAAFGAPVAHENDTQRAIMAALDLRAPPPQLSGLSPAAALQIGISQGTMRVGAYGGVTCRTYGVLGDEVNLAARLMERAAPDQIIVSQRVVDAALPSSRYRFRALGTATLKGKRDSIPIFELLEPSTEATQRAPHSTPIVGRRHERERLAEHLRRLLAGDEVGPLLIEGEAGIGKSRLVENLLQQAQALGVLTFVGGGDAIEQTTRYHAWRPIVSQIFALDTLPDDADIRRAHVLAQLAEAPELLRRAPLLNDMLPLDLPDNDLTVQMSGQVRADNAAALLANLLRRAASERPVLVVIEDAHWMDSASWLVTRRAHHDVRPMLQVIVTRPLEEPVSADYRALASAQGAQRLKLETLPSADIAALVCQCLGVAALPDELATLIQEKAEGHPFYSEELAYAMRDSGLIVLTGGPSSDAPARCAIAPQVDLKTVALPDTIQGVITSRIDRLPPSHQLVLKVASVIGRAFALRVVHDVYPIAAERPSLTSYLADAQHLDLTLIETPEPDPSYLFKHAITREVTYNLMLFVQRREFHRAVAEWYERTHADDLTPHYQLLAHHWDHAEASPKTIDYAEKAGEQAIRSGAYREAIGFFRRALELDQPPQEKQARLRHARWQRQLGEAFLGIGNIADSRAHFLLALAHLDQPFPRSSAGIAWGIITAIARQALHHLLPARFLGRASEPDVNRDLWRIYVELAQLAYLHNQPIAMLYAVLQNLNNSEGLGPSLELASAYTGIAIACGAMMLRRLGDYYVAQAQRMIALVEQPAAIAEIKEYIGVYRAGGGRLAEATAAFDYAVGVFEQIGHRRMWEETATLLGMTLMPRGEIARAAELWRQLSIAGKQHGSTQTECWALLGQAQIALLQQRLVQAIDLLERAKPLVEQASREDPIWLYGMLGRAHWRSGAAIPAREAADMALAVASKTPPVNFQVHEGYAGMVEVYLACWEAARSGSPTEQRALRQSAHKALKALDKFARIFPLARAHALLYRGGYEWLAGRPERARRQWLGALEAARRLALPYVAGMAQYELGRHLGASAAARASYLEGSLEIFRGLGAAYDVERAMAALRQQ